MYPLIICSHGRVVIASNDWFKGIGHLDFSERYLRINLNRLGESGLRWMLDANGLFHELHWQGLEPEKLLQKLSLTKRIERYSISSPRQISARELSSLVDDLSEAFEEAPNATDLRTLLAKMSPDEFVTRELMLEYLGE